MSRRFVRLLIAVSVATPYTGGQTSVDSLVRDNLRCGPACVLFVLHFYGKHDPPIDFVKNMISKAEESGKGLTIKDLVTYLQDAGVPAIAAKLRLKEIANLGKSPSIIYEDPKSSSKAGHFSVLVFSGQDDSVFVVDPPNHAVRHNVSHVSDLYTPYVVLTGDSVQKFGMRPVKGIFPFSCPR